MAKTDITVDKLVRMVEHGQLRLPELKRRYISPTTRVRDPLDSLYRNCPSGSILAWRADDRVAERAMGVAQRARSPFGWNQLLLDGQQRLTSLAAIVRYRKDGWGQRTFYVHNGKRTDSLRIEDAHRYVDGHFG